MKVNEILQLGSFLLLLFLIFFSFYFIVQLKVWNLVAWFDLVKSLIVEINVEEGKDIKN